MIGSKVLFSHKSNHWSTPEEVYNELNDEFKFTYDPCPLNADFNGLFKDWIGNIFINPPYDNIANFLDKGLLEIKKGNAKTLVYLIPSRTDTKWFHKYVVGFKAEIRFIKGRLKFGNSKNSAPFPSMLIIFKKK